MNKLFSMPKLSFIVTSFNYEEYIEECIQSILAQTYENIEIIIVDDHSIDHSVDVINKIIQNNYSRTKIKLIKHDRTKGQLASIFDGILASTGEFIACIDSDDKIAPDYASTHICIQMFTPCALTVCEHMEIDAKSKLHCINSPNIPKTGATNTVDELRLKYKNLNVQSIIKRLNKKEYFFGGWWWAPTSCGVFRKSAIQPFLTFMKHDNWRTSPDKLLFNFLHLVGGSTKIYKPLVLYRRHGMNAGQCNYVIGDKRYNSDAAREKYLKNQINLYKDILEFFKLNKKKLIKIFSKRHYNAMKREIYFSIPKLIIYKLMH